MKRRKQNKINHKKLFLLLVSLIFGGIGFYLFIIGLFSLLKLAPIVNTTPNSDVVAPIGEQATVAKLKVDLLKKNIRLTEIFESTKSGVIVAKIKEGPEVYFSPTKNAEFQANSLHLIMSKLTIDNKKPSLIDLRYERPIVKF